MSHFYQFVKSVIHGYRKDDCSNFAAVISFYAIFSMLPLAMIAVAFVSSVLGSAVELVARFQFLLEGVLPAAAEELFLVIQTALEKRQRVSVISTGILIVLASFLVSAMERALDRVFRTEKKREFVANRQL